MGRARTGDPGHAALALPALKPATALGSLHRGGVGHSHIVATKREAHYVLDEIRERDRHCRHRARDGHPRVTFGLFDLLGLQLSPRIRDLGTITLYRAGSRTQVELFEPSRLRRAESGTRGLPADADRAPMRFPRRARLYV
ncbi:Tn3 family transposase [Nonomuraea dietziae]|uniref:Tn3 family transposase n=1 Tax=Nonomuraea dietziae TaxID=65515 RepID=UPI0034196DCD